MADTKDQNVELLRAKLEAQKKDKLLHLMAGLFVGLVVGFFGANWMNSHPGLGAPSAAIPATGEMPADHPAVDPSAGGGGQQAAMPEVQAKLKKADDNPQDYDAQMEAAAMFYRIQNFDRAITYLDRARQLRPDDYETLVYLANTNYDAGRYDKAQPLYEQAVQKKPDDIDVRTDLGSTYFYLGQLDKAIETYQTSLKTNPTHEKTLQNLAMVLLKKGDAAGAEDALNRLASVNPQNQSLGDLRKELEQLKTTGKIPTH